MLQYLISIFFLLVAIFLLNRYFSGTSYTDVKPNLWGKLAIITGGNTGIGKQTAIDLAQQGCKVIIGARDTNKSETFVQAINTSLGKCMVSHLELDLANTQSISKFVDQLKQYERIDILINNAGVMALPKHTLTKKGYEMHYAINHLGHFLLTHLLWQKLKKSQFYRIINISSIAHKNQLGFFKTTTLDFNDINFSKGKYSPTLAYARSKLYNNLFTHALAEKIVKNKGIVVSVHPGVVRTELTRYMVTGWMEIVMKIVYPIYAIFTKSAKQGAQTTLAVVYLPKEQLKNGGFYADCRQSTQNKLVTKQNWDELWQISQKQLKIKFKN